MLTEVDTLACPRYKGVFLARGGRKYGNTSFASVARAGHNTDMIDTGKRARNTSGTQGSSLHDMGEKRSEQIVKHTCIRLDFRRSLVSRIRSSPRGRNAGSFTRTATVNQCSLYYCPYMYLLQVLIGSLDCFSLSFVIGPSEYCFLERFSTECRKIKIKAMNLFGDAAAISDSIISNNYYRMLRGEHSIIAT